MLAGFMHLYYRHDMVKANDQHVLWQLESISFFFVFQIPRNSEITFYIPIGSDAE